MKKTKLSKNINTTFQRLPKKISWRYRFAVFMSEIKQIFIEIPKNKKLIKRYPFLQIAQNYYNRTFLDDMPIAWKKKFGIQMCEDIRKELIKFDYLKEYSLMQVKEKYGTLRWYDMGVPKDSKINDIVSYYEDVSAATCQYCGKPSKYCTDGWIMYVCEDCLLDHLSEESKCNKDELNEYLDRCRCYANDIKHQTTENGILVDKFYFDFSTVWPKRPDDKIEDDVEVLEE